MSNYIKKLNFPNHYEILKIDLPSRRRDWMEVNNGHAYKCLPLSVANGYGWHILCPMTFEATWNGNISHTNAIDFKFYPEEGNLHDEYITKYNLISSHFGSGIITFSGMSYIIRTSSENNLYVKGPTNYFKHGAQALEAIIETDWIPYNFTLNWKITEPNMTVKFVKGEPIATLFPIPRNYLENFKAEDETLSTEDEVYKEHIKWVKKREEMVEVQKQHGYYTRGLENIEENKIFKNHQRSIMGCPFANLKKEEKND
jgi:hypothetical protein